MRWARFFSVIVRVFLRVGFNVERIDGTMAPFICKDVKCIKEIFSCPIRMT